MTITEMGARLGVATCVGGCGLSDTRHRTGTTFMGTVHYAERRYTKRGAKNYLVLVARMDREADPGYLNNIELYDWLYEWKDATTAWRLGWKLGIKIPSRLFDDHRQRCLLYAARRGVKLTRYPAIYQWAKSAIVPKEPTPIEERFWSKVDKGDGSGCWIWTGARLPSGYGKIQIRAEGRNPSTHRLSWEMHYGPVPVGLSVLHRCDNPPCVRPDHLFVGTAQDNVNDAIAKGRFRPRGKLMAPR